MDRLGGLGDKKFPHFSFQTTSKWQYPFTRTQMESYSKNDSCCGKLLQRGACEELPLLSAGLRAQFFFLFPKRTMIISELRGSPGCGCLPRYVALQFVCDSVYNAVSWEFWRNIPKMITATLTTYLIKTYSIFKNITPWLLFSTPKNDAWLRVRNSA